MHNNAFILKRYSDSLRKQLVGNLLIECVSTSLTDIHLLFSGDIYISIKFYKQHTFFLQPNSENFPKKNVLQQFSEILGKRITDVRGYTNDRGIQLSLGNYSLDIQCYGRRSSLLLSKNNEVIDHFKTTQPPTFIERKPRTMVFSSSPTEFKRLNPFVPDAVVEELISNNFFQKEDIETVWKTFYNQFQTRPIVINKLANSSVELSVYPREETIESYTSITKAFHDFARLFMANDRFTSLQGTLITDFQKELKKQKNRLKKLQSHYIKLTEGQSLKEIGDILMANLYNIPEKSESVRLFNFYSNEEIDIALKENLSPQKNAERYYQKSKNIHIEVAHTKKMIQSAQKSIDALHEQLEFVQTAKQYRDIQKLDKSRLKESEAQSLSKQLPYREYTFKGYAIWVGKSAKNNDELLKRTQKTDIWFHARGVAGSHVLLKNPSGEKVPDDVLEHAASLAAKFSKNQHDTLAAVIYTNPKYVRKFKGALPGQVRVDREEVILVKPFDRK